MMYQHKQNNVLSKLAEHQGTVHTAFADGIVTGLAGGIRVRDAVVGNAADERELHQQLAARTEQLFCVQLLHQKNRFAVTEIL